VTLLQDEERDRTYELGGPAFDLHELSEAITQVTDTPVSYTDLPVDEYARRLEQAGLDAANARFVAALDTSIAHGDLETTSHDLEQLLGHPATRPPDAVRAASLT
jgi:NAD(P)H dehydrogenase (quinone)